MIKIWIQIVVSAVVFILLQSLVVNYVHLFGLATPFIYIYVILKLPLDLSRSLVIFIAFLTGLSVDMFSNTFGMHAAACSLLGLARLPLAKLIVDMREAPEGMIPSYRLGFGVFFRYVALLTAIHHIALFVIEFFGFFQPLMMTVRMTLSFMLTLLLIMVIEAFNLSRVKSND